MNQLWPARLHAEVERVRRELATREARAEADAQLERDLIEAACWKAAEQGYGVLVTRKSNGTLLRAEPNKYVPAGQMYIVQNYGAEDVWTPVKKSEGICDFGGCSDHSGPR